MMIITMSVKMKEAKMINDGGVIEYRANTHANINGRGSCWFDES